MDRPVPRREHGAGWRRLAVATAWLLAATGAAASDPYPLQLAGVPEDLTQLSLEDLMRIEVTSVSRRAEPLSDAAAAIAVLTGDDIRRSGARNIAEALRLIPGMEVAATGAQGYAVSARGFNSTTSDKLEVLLDGRSVYTPLYSGVFWDRLDTYLPDIDRIEVIRGPGAALWGANAVNGVINIITKSADRTLGTAVTTAAGTEQRGYVGVRSGSRLGENGAIRFYGFGHERDRSERRDGSEAEDGMRFKQFGTRADYSSGGDTLTISGDYYESTQRATSATQQRPVDYDADGANLLARWARETGGGRLSIQAYFDHSEWRLPTLAAETRDTLDLDIQHGFTLGERHHLLYGFGYRSSKDRTGTAPDYAIIFEPADRRLDTVSAFVQDQIALSDSTTLTLGSKFEHNDFTGFEFQPNARIGWRVSPQLFTWASLARAVRTPNRIDSDIAILCPEPNGFPGICGPGVFRVGNADLDSEKLHAVDAGVRIGTGARASLDLALFYNRYSDLRSTETDVLLGRFANTLKGESYGAELSGSWQVAPSLTLQASYAWLELDIDGGADSTDTTTATNREGSAARHRAGLRTSWHPAQDWSVDAFLRHVSSLRYQEVPAYTELNLRTAWRLRPGLELALIGQNLLDDRHAEWGRSATRAEIERAAVIELHWELR